jgi:hypothetical protein
MGAAIIGNLFNIDRYIERDSRLWRAFRRVGSVSHRNVGSPQLSAKCLYVLSRFHQSRRSSLHRLSTVRLFIFFNDERQCQRSKILHHDWK